MKYEVKTKIDTVKADDLDKVLCRLVFSPTEQPLLLPQPRNGDPAHPLLVKAIKDIGGFVTTTESVWTGQRTVDKHPFFILKDEKNVYFILPTYDEDEGSE